MGTVFFLRRDFEGAAKQRFIDTSRTLMEQAEDLFSRQPGIHDSDLQFLLLDLHPLKKLEVFMELLPEDHRRAPPQRRQFVQNLSAGVLVYEQIRQSREWVEYYETFARPVCREEMDGFPPLNVRDLFTEEIHACIAGRTYPVHVQYALGTSAKLYESVRMRDEAMRHKPEI